WVAPWARGSGVATRATRAISGWAHRNGLPRVELLTEPENWASQRVALRSGYRSEGLRRGGGVLRDGTLCDLIVWARLAGDALGPSPRLLPDLPGGSLADGTVTLRPLSESDAGDSHALQ